MFEFTQSTLLFMLPVFGAAALIIVTIATSAMSSDAGDERSRNDDTDWRR